MFAEQGESRLRERKEMFVEAGESPRSPEAKLGMQVEDLWDVMEPQLSPTEKLNACFESIPVSSFPSAPTSECNFLFFRHQRFDFASLWCMGMALR